MTGTGPLSKAPAGHFNFEPPPPGRTIYLEPTPKRIRVEVGGEVIADSRRALHAAGVRAAADLLLPAAGRPHRRDDADGPPHALPQEGRRLLLHDPGRRRDRGERRLVLPGAAPGRPLPQGPGGLLLRPDGPVAGGGRGDRRPPARPVSPRRRAAHRPSHPRPRSTASCWPRPSARWRCSSPTCRRAGTSRATTCAPAAASDTVTRCPYKGTASYYSVKLAGGGEGTDLVWYYDAPLAEVGRIAGLLCFFNEKVDIELDGEFQERPESPWSRRVRSDAPAKAAAD